MDKLFLAVQFSQYRCDIDGRQYRDNLDGIILGLFDSVIKAIGRFESHYEEEGLIFEDYFGYHGIVGVKLSSNKSEIGQIIEMKINQSENIHI